MTLPAGFREVFVLWPGWQELVGYVSTSSPRDVDPHDVYGAALAADHDRLVARLYGHHVGGTLEEAGEILDELLELACAGRRPRFGREIGITAETLGLSEVSL